MKLRVPVIEVVPMIRKCLTNNVHTAANASLHIHFFLWGEGPEEIREPIRPLVHFVGVHHVEAAIRVLPARTHIPHFVSEGR